METQRNGRIYRHSTHALWIRDSAAFTSASLCWLSFDLLLAFNGWKLRAHFNRSCQINGGLHFGQVRLPKKRLAGRVSAAGFIEISAKKKISVRVLSLS